MSRVLSTSEAKESIVKMQQITNGPLLDQINALKHVGQILSDPNVWDSALAQDFRVGWTETHSTLLRAIKQLEQLRSQVQQINANIMTAGGSY